MAKIKKAFICQSCGSSYPKWSGQCSSCGEWNTLVEEVVEKTGKSVAADSGLVQASKPILLQDIDGTEENRMLIPDNELNRVLGGGFVPGSISLVGGEPGIGKSTLMPQLAVALKGKKVLYVSGEESDKQIKMRAERIGAHNESCYLLSETNVGSIFSHIKAIDPDLIIIDSIQTLYSPLLEAAPGSVSQIRQCTAELLKFAKGGYAPVVLIGHITKEGQLAGPKVLEHMVDTVLQFEGDRNHLYRLLRATKNRFGSTNELGIYEMQGSGLREVTNPSEILISNRDSQLSGTSIAATLEGLRPMLIETQALVSTAVYGTPQRSATGFDLRRLSMLLAVLEKRCGFRLGTKDVFLNIAGGIRVDDPAIDLAVVSAVLSSNEDVPVSGNICLAGEVGLSGEIRPVTRIEQRIAEAEKLGFEEIIISAYNARGLDLSKSKINVKPVLKIEEVFNRLFG